MEQKMQDAKMPKLDRQWLVYRQSYESSMRKGAASKAITEYLEAIGYQQSQMNPTLIFQRGSGLASLYHPSPKRQFTEISIDFANVGEQSIVEIAMRINRLGNLPLSKDYEFWQAELDSLALILQGGQAETRLSDYAADRAMWYSVSVMLGVLLVTMGVLMAILLAVILIAQ